jgi:hypothetical protein
MVEGDGDLRASAGTGEAEPVRVAYHYQQSNDEVMEVLAEGLKYVSDINNRTAALVEGRTTDGYVFVLEDRAELHGEVWGSAYL